MSLGDGSKTFLPISRGGSPSWITVAGGTAVTNNAFLFSSVVEKQGSAVDHVVSGDGESLIRINMDGWYWIEACTKLNSANASGFTKNTANNVSWAAAALQGSGNRLSGSLNATNTAANVGGMHYLSHGDILRYTFDAGTRVDDTNQAANYAKVAYLGLC